MQTDMLAKGRILKMDDKEYMIIHRNKDNLFLIERGITAIRLIIVDVITILDCIIEGIATTEPLQLYLFNRYDLPEKVRNQLETYELVVKEIEKTFGPDFLRLKQESKKAQDIFKKHNISPKTGWKTVRRYLQSGCEISALVDRRQCPSRKSGPYHYTKKPGRKYSSGITAGVVVTDETRNIFDIMVRYWKKKPFLSISKLYDYMLMMYFIDEDGKILPITERPTKAQLQYYLNKTIDKEEKKILKHGYRKYRNDMRPLEGDTTIQALGPGFLLETDAQEFPFYPVTEHDKSRTGTKAILYMLKDVYSKMIVAYFLSYENNSFLGITNLLANLFCDREKYCARFGITYDESWWPKPFIPQILRTDRGAEYNGKRLEDVLSELNIAFEPVPGAMGSAKGNVEGGFSEFLREVGPALHSHGLVEKKYGSRHQEEAILPLKELDRIALLYVKYHNTKSRTESYPITKDQIEKNVEMTAACIWAYGVEKFGEPMPISSKEHMLFSLCAPAGRVVVKDKGLYLSGATLRKGGSKDPGLYYVCPEDKDLERERKSARNHTREFSVECRLDHRDLGKLYYIRKGTLFTARLSEKINGNADYHGCSLYEYTQLQERREEKARETDEASLQKSVEFQSDINKIVNENASDKYSYNKGLKKTQAQEKMKAKSSRPLQTILGTEEKQEDHQPEISADEDTVNFEEYSFWD